MIYLGFKGLNLGHSMQSIMQRNLLFLFQSKLDLKFLVWGEQNHLALGRRMWYTTGYRAMPANAMPGFKLDQFLFKFKLEFSLF